MQDAIIAGFGKLSGGNYKKLSIKGHGSVCAAVCAEEISVMGSGKFLDTVDGKIVKSNGDIIFNKELKSEEIYINGSLTCESNIKTKLLRVNGKVKIKEDLNVDLLKARLRNSSIKNIYGQSVDIKCKKQESNILKIEANNIELANIKVEKVSGNNVSIFGRSNIAIVEYKESLTIGNKVNIGKVIRL